MRYKIVPVEPTEEMEDALWGAMFEEPRDISPITYAGISAMLAAAPKASEDEELVSALLDTPIWRDASGIATTLRDALDGWNTESAARAVLKMLEGEVK